MILQNKKTGVLGVLEATTYHGGRPDNIIEVYEMGMGAVKVLAQYKTLEELLEEWEDYEPKEPLFNDEKIRKAIRTWLSIQKQPITAISILCSKDHDGFFCYHLYGYIDKARIVDGRAVVNNNLKAIDFEFRSNESIEYEPHRDYTIAELCGEEEE